MPKLKAPQPMNNDSALIDKTQSFKSLQLDVRLLKALKKMGFKHPSLVQATAIPLALQGKDVLAKAKTGSGKTLAYLLPMIQMILEDNENQGNDAKETCRGLILVPTSELVQQLRAVLKSVLKYCNDVVRYCGCAADDKVDVQAPRLRENASILVATPGRLIKHIRIGNVKLDNVKLMVIDEADLILSYGYSKDIDAISRALPSVYQAMLVSATLEGGVTSLKQLLLHDPAVIRLEDAVADPSESGAGSGKLKEYAAHCSVKDKYLIVYALLKLGVLPGKSLIFVNNINRCYRLKLLLERFGINAGVLNADLPQNSRHSIVNQFNRDLFDILIATDASLAGVTKDLSEQLEIDDEIEQFDSEEDDDSDEDDDDDDDDDDEEEEESSEDNEDTVDIVTPKKSGPSPRVTRSLAKKRAQMAALTPPSDDEKEEEKEEEEKTQSTSNKRKRKNDKEIEQDSDDNDDDNDDNDDDEMEEESSKDTSTKQTSKAKSNKRARLQSEFSAARGVDFVGVDNVINFDFPKSYSAYVHRIGRTARGGADGLALSLIAIGKAEDRRCKRMSRAREQQGAALQPFEFQSSGVHALRYRVDDMLHTIGRRAVRDARAAALRHELINSERLKSHFEDNPRELSLLKHNVPVARSKVRPHLTYIPKYLLPKSVDAQAVNANAIREQKFVLTSNEMAAERFDKKRFNKRTGGDPLKKWKPRRNQDEKPFNDDLNEWGMKKNDKMQNGTKFGRKQFHKMKKGGFV